MKNPDRERIVERYSGQHRNFLNFLCGWISAAGKTADSEELAEIAATIDAVLERETREGNGS